MRRRRALWLAVGLAVLVAGLLVWRARESAGPSSPRRPTARAPSRALDLERFRAHVRARRAAAARLPQARRERPPSPLALVTSLSTPRCILGPAELCALVVDTLDDCDSGDGEACLAAAQYLEDTPPRPTVVISVYYRGCKAGEAAACARLDELKRRDLSVDEACDRDPILCTFVARREHDLDGLDRACADGVADACAILLDDFGLDAAAARHYLTVACELGNPMTCDVLAARLSPDCTSDCYPPDPAQAATAALIACEAGFAEACRDVR